MSQRTLSRRRFIEGVILPTLALCATRSYGKNPSFDAPLSFQVHTLRRSIQDSFDETLHTLRKAGFSAIEMASFPGFAGNAHGDFGPLAKEPPRQLARRIAAAGLHCKGCLFLPQELFDAHRIDTTLQWAHELRLEWIILAGLEDFPDKEAVALSIERLEAASMRVRAAGFKMAVHTDQAQWASIEGRTIVEHLLAGLSPDSISFELDLGGVIAYGIDPVELLRSHPRRFQALHMRDGRRPADPRTYVPACLPGQGVVDWARLLPAARRAGIQDYVVEMESHTGHELAETVQAYSLFRTLRG